MRTPSRKAKSKKKPAKATQPVLLKSLIAATVKLWRKSHLTYDQARHVAKEARAALSISRVKTRKRVVQRLSRDEEQRLIRQACKDKGAHGLLIKTLFQTGARVSEFAGIRVVDLFFDELMILINKGEGRKESLRADPLRTGAGATDSSGRA